MGKAWTQSEDECLKMLRDDLKINRWSDIANQLERQYGVSGRNQKQCRERYQNHLNSSVSSKKLTKDREIQFFRIHDQIGNKWAQISQQFPGLSDNYLKNIFHSKLRGAIRKLNRETKEHPEFEHKIYRVQITYRLIEACHKFKETLTYSEEQKNFCIKLKNKLLEYNGCKTVHHLYRGFSEREMYRDLIEKLSLFENLKMDESKEKSKPQVSNDASTEHKNSEVMDLEIDSSPTNEGKKSVLKEKGQAREGQPQTCLEEKPAVSSEPHFQVKLNRPEHQHNTMLTQKKTLETAGEENGLFSDPLNQDIFDHTGSNQSPSQNDDHMLELLPLPETPFFEDNSPTDNKMIELSDGWLEGFNIENILEEGLYE